jgi:hypothetical protein
MKLLAANKRMILPAVVVFALISLFFIYNLSNTFNVSTSIELENDNATTIVRKENTNIIENTALVDQIKVTKETWESCLNPGQEPSLYLSIVIVTRVDNYAG